jgi:hypothetical protein
VPYDTSVYTLAVSAGGVGALQLNTNSIRLAGIQILQTSSTNLSYALEITGLGGVLVMDGVKLNTVGGSNSIGMRASGVGGVYVIRNCHSRAAVNGFVIGNATGLPANSEIYMYNNTIVGTSALAGEALYLIAASSSATILRAKNNAMRQIVNGLTQSGWGTSDLVTNSHTAALGSSFTNAATGDFTLVSGDTVLKDQGTDLSAVGAGQWQFSDDASLYTRPFNSVWDIGMHEYRP